MGSLQTGRRFIDVEDLWKAHCFPIGTKREQTINLTGGSRDIISLGEVIEVAQEFVVSESSGDGDKAGIREHPQPG